jgi:uncharacterized membrane protein YbhN (UPF0104 family)
VPVLLVVAGCIFILPKVDFPALEASLLTVRVWPLCLALLFAALGVVAHSTYWWLLVGTVTPVSLRAMTAYGFASYATNILPMRAGEGLRVWLVRSRHGVPVAMSGAIIAIEKVADATSLLVLITPLPWLIPNIPSSVSKWLVIWPGVVVAAFVAVAIASRHASRWKILSGFTVVRKPKVIVAGFGCVFVAWLFDVSAILSVLVATHLAPTLDKALLVILSVNLAVALPVTPGQVGAHELGSTVALAIVGVPETQAIPFAILYHATQLLPTLVIGLWTARVLSKEAVAAPVEAPPSAS